MASKTIRPTTITCPQRILVPDIAKVLCATALERMLEAEVALPTKAPFDATVVLHDAGDVLAEPLLELARPRHELEAQTVFNHGEASRGERQTLAIRTSHMFPGGRLHVRQADVGRDFCRHLVQFTSAQRVQKVALQDDVLAVPARQTFLN